MKARLLVFCVGVLSLYRFTLAQAPSGGQTPAHASFGVLKSLAGTWTGAVTTEPHAPDIEGPIQVTLSVASGGSAVVHQIAPGGVSEPTLIYEEGDRLTLVHYCEAGNRPRLFALRLPDEKTVAFDFADISGDTKPLYLQHFVFTIVNADQHIEDWTFMLDGDKPLHARFDLRRANKSP